MQNYSFYCMCDAADIVKLLTDCMVNSKENIDDSILASFRNRNLVTIRALLENFTMIPHINLSNKVIMKSIFFPPLTFLLFPTGSSKATQQNHVKLFGGTGSKQVP